MSQRLKIIKRSDGSVLKLKTKLIFVPEYGSKESKKLQKVVKNSGCKDLQKFIENWLKSYYL
jgi:hypothetical protein